MGGSSKKQTVGYKYRVGMHLGWVRGPIDKITKFAWDKRVAWIGEAKSGDQIYIDAPNLFGGEKQEGGVQGYIDVEFGEPTQGRNDYLAKYLDSKTTGSALNAVSQLLFGVDFEATTTTQATQAQQELVPAFRGFVGTVLRHFYVGMNPYLKNMAIFGQRIHVRQDGIAQWYDEKAEISADDGSFHEVLVSSSEEDWDATDPAIVSTSLSVPPSGYFEINTISTTDIIKITVRSGGEYVAWSPWSTDGEGPPEGPWTCSIIVSIDGTPGVDIQTGASSKLFYETAEDAFNNFTEVELTGGLNYKFFLHSDPVEDDRGGLSPKFEHYTTSLTGDMNPAHAIREGLTDPDWGMGYPEADADDTNFRAAADLFFQEQFGVSYLWDRQSPVIEFVKEVAKTVNAVVRVDRRTGKFVIKPIRDDYSIGSLLTLDEATSVLGVQSIEVPTFDELANSIVVKYWDNDKDEVASTSLQNPALSVMQQSRNGAAVNYPGITRKALADRVAYRDLKVLSTPLTTVVFYANRKAYTLAEGDPFILNLPKHKINNMVMRVTEMSFGNGRDNKIKIKCTQDVFAFPDLQLVGDGSLDGGWDNPNKDPLPAVYRVVTEAPYYELVQRNGQTYVDDHLTANQEIGYLLASAARPATELNMDLLVDAGAGYEESGPIDFSPLIILAASVDPTETVFSYTTSTDLTEVTIGTHAGLGTELVRVDAVDEVAMTVTVGRGVLDTVPTEHLAGTPMLFWDAYADGDNVEYVISESIDVKMLPSNGTAKVAEADAPVDTVVMNQRAYRPYPPGNLTIEGQTYPQYIDGVSDLDVAWAHRDRLQQTSGTIYDTTYGNIGPELNTVYNLVLTRIDTGATISSATGVTGTSQNLSTGGYEGGVKLTLESSRDGLVSWQKHEWDFFVTPNDVMLYEDGTQMLYEDGTYMIYEGE